MVENAVLRYQTIFGTAMRSRSLMGQRIEASLACKILNTMSDSAAVQVSCECREPKEDAPETPRSLHRQ